MGDHAVEAPSIAGLFDVVKAPSLAAIDAEVNRVFGDTFQQLMWAHTGSGYIWGEGKDIDVLVDFGYNQEDWLEGMKLLDLAGYKVKHDHEYDGIPAELFYFARHPMNGYNMIVSHGRDRYQAMVTARDVCKELAKHGRITPDDKLARVVIHRIIRDQLETPVGTTFI